MTLTPARPHAVRRPTSSGAAHGADTPRKTTSLRASLWRVAEALATPLVPADYLDLFDPLREGADLRGRIVAVTPQTRDAVTLTIKPGRSWRGHLPGQYIRIGVDIDGVRHWRAYSVNSVPEPLGKDTTIAITVKAITDGLVSNHLVRTARPGTLVMLDQATGDFVLPQRAPEKVLFISAGSGITPIIGMLRSRPDLPDVTHIHCSPTQADVIFAAELNEYGRTGRTAYLERHDDVHGMLNLADLDHLVPDWRERQTWVCGPTGLLDAAEDFWSAAGLRGRLTVERFRPTIIEPGEGGSITFLTSDTVVDATGATPILDAGEAAGVLMPSGCRMGICMGCVVTMRQGAVRDLRTGEITTAEPGDDLPVQTCINAVAGSCDLDL
ncbi:MAG TPA: ferredoxin reductase [Intrasporangiaceae bacterium]|nr:ferredoxin reductase [Intrasporangiaceae bacterium]